MIPYIKMMAEAPPTENLMILFRSNRFKKKKREIKKKK